MILTLPCFFRHALRNNDDWYSIEFMRCNTHKQSVLWVEHLCDKKWITTKHISLFLCSVYAKFPELAPKEPIA